MKKVVILQRVLKKYRVPFYKALKPALLKSNIELLVIHGRENRVEGLKNDSGFLDWAIQIRNLYLPFGLLWQFCWSNLRNADLVIVEQANGYLLNYLLMLKRLRKKQKLAFLGHGLTCQKQYNSIANIFKRKMIKNVDWWFAYTEGVGELVVSQGFPRERITVFQNAVDVNTLIEIKNRTNKNELDLIKRKLGLGGGPVGIFCGGMYPEKKISFLLDACERIKQYFIDFEIIFLGSGIDANLVISKAKENKWMHYIGPCFEEDKVRYFMLADIFLLPGLVGLATLDSFALETPIITTNFPYHSPEVEYIINGVNGIIADDNLDKYVEEVKYVLSNPVKLENLKTGCRVGAGKYTLERMVENFTQGIVRCLNDEG